jgi:hypothetical protein
MRTPTCCLGAVAILSVLSVCSFAVSGTYEGPTWKGKIVITYQESGGDSSKSTVNQADHESLWSFSNVTKVVLNVCGDSLEQGYVKDATVDHTHSWLNTTRYQRSVCQPRGEIKKPGWGKKEEGLMSATVNPGLRGLRVKPSLSVSLQPSGNIRYTIAAGITEVPIAFETGKSESQQHDPCEGKSTSHTITTVTDPDPLQKDAYPKTTCSGDGRICRSTVLSRPMSFPMVFTYTGTTTDLDIIGSTKIPLGEVGQVTVSAVGKQLEEMARQMPPELRGQMMEEAAKIQQDSPEEKQGKRDPTTNKGETTKALYVSWYIAKRNPCDDVNEQLKQDLSMIQAYADPTLVSRARREGWPGWQYDGAVYKYGTSIYASGWWEGGFPGSPSGYSGDPPPDPGQNHIDMALNDEKCSIEGQDKARNAAEKDCVPQIVPDSILEHEKTHAKQCMSKDTAAEFASKTPDSFRKFEQSAYCAGVKKLMNWAQGRCKESDLKPLRDVYRTYCPR